MKSCLIIGNPDSPSDEKLRYHSLYPTILYLFMMSGFTHIYLSPNNAYERMAFFDYSRWKPMLETLRVVMYNFSAVGELVFPTGSVPEEGVEMDDVQTVINKVTHVLYVGFPRLPSSLSHHTFFHLTLEQLRDGSIAPIMNLLLWMEGFISSS